MKRFTFLIFMVISLASCTYFQQPKTLDQVKADFNCIGVEKGIRWTEVSEKFGPPDLAPLPEPGMGLARNTRVYKGETVIFYIELKEVKEGEKVRFQEIITNIEVCKKKR